MSDTPSALVWRGYGLGRKIAFTPFGTNYLVSPLNAGEGEVWRAFYRQSEIGENGHPDEPSARAACEADYARRWREAGLVPAGEVERLLEALRAARTECCGCLMGDSDIPIVIDLIDTALAPTGAASEGERT